MVTSGLDSLSEAIVHRVWAERLGVTPAVFEGDEPVFVHRPDLQAVVVVRLGKKLAVAAPERALSPLRRLAGPRLLDTASLLEALEPFRPSLFGVASLSFADHHTIAPATDGTARAATDADVEAVISRCSTDERDESGLLHMNTRWITADDNGEPAGVAGYEVWGGGLAHVGVAVATESRKRGLGARAATVAAMHAIGAGLVPQWRCRLDNVASARVGKRLGFAPVGEQIAIDLEPFDHEIRHAARR